MATKNKMSSEAWAKVKESRKEVRPMEFAEIPKNRIGRKQRRKMERMK